MLASTGGGDDARLRRAQAGAGSSPLGLELARELLAAKLRGQAAIVREFPGGELLADAIGRLTESMDSATTVDELRFLEASAAGGYWQAWAEAPVLARFTRRDVGRVA